MKTNRLILIVCLLVLILGCATAVKKDAPADLSAQLLELSEIIAKKDAVILKKEAEIIALQKLLNDSAAEIKDRDLKIDALKGKLKGFGVFE
ncbi:MAG: hypothetical protein WC695_04110 [Candidatus Omnitrophota bacterium]